MENVTSKVENVTSKVENVTSKVENVTSKVENVTPIRGECYAHSRRMLRPFEENVTPI